MKNIFLKHYKFLLILFSFIIVLSFITYSLVTPGGFFKNLKGDLKTIQSDASVVYRSLNGDIIDLSAFAGKPLIINSWATWMPFSSTELDILNKIQKEFMGQVTILAINRKEDPIIMRAYLETLVPLNELLILVDENDNFYKSINGYAMPETVFYGADGTLIIHKRGALIESEIRDYIQQVLAQ